MAASSDIKPFTISIPDSSLQDLRTRLSLTRFPDELTSADWHYGAPLADIKRLVSHWLNTYSWRTAESHLNTLPHYTTPVTVKGFEPLNIHFLHARSPNPNAIPLLFVHGWPGSFIEATKILEPLTHPDNASDPAFHVVAPSLPNYGFSSGPSAKGFALTQYAETCHNLMLKLGYTTYVTQGGDWGYFITRTISLLYPTHCRATHINMNQGTPPKNSKYPVGTLFPDLSDPELTESERKGVERTKWFLQQGSGYRTQQATKPQTLAYGLADSPVGLLAWIYEKLHDWTDSYPWADDEVCTWVSIYWFSTAGPGASLRIYYEATHEWDDPATRVSRERTGQFIGGGVKLGLSHNPKELRVLPSSWTRGQGDVVYEKRWERGGHFMAWEKPQNLVGDFRAMFGRGGGAADVIQGKSGY